MARTLLPPQFPSLTSNSVTNSQPLLRAAAVEDRLRARRSNTYIEAMKRLDAGAHIHDRQALDKFLADIRREFPDIELQHLPLGIVARCYLGAPYEVHTLDQVGQIIDHYKRGESLPPLMERARSLSLYPGYAFVEVYVDKLIAVTEEGDTSIVKG